MPSIPTTDITKEDAEIALMEELLVQRAQKEVRQCMEIKNQLEQSYKTLYESIRYNEKVDGIRDNMFILIRTIGQGLKVIENQLK